MVVICEFLGLKRRKRLISITNISTVYSSKPFVCIIEDLLISLLGTYGDKNLFFNLENLFTITVMKSTYFVRKKEQF